MNAVERLVEVGDDLVRFFKECGRDWLGLTIAVIQGRSPIKLADLPIDQPDGPRILLEAFMTGLPAPQRRALEKKHEQDLAGLAEISPEYLDRVGSLLIFNFLFRPSSWTAARLPETWQGLLADVCKESPAWGALSKPVVDLAQAIAIEANGLIGLPHRLGYVPKPIQQKLRRIEDLLSKLRIYSKANAWAGAATVADSGEGCDAASASTPTAMKSAGGDERQRRGRRTGAAAGGAPKKYTHPKLNKALSAWKKDRQKACSVGQLPPRWSGWLHEYCIKNGVDINAALPEKYRDEPWDERADRCKEALKRRRDRERGGGRQGQRTTTNSDTNRTVPLPAGAGATGHSVSRGQQTPSLLP